MPEFVFEYSFSEVLRWPLREGQTLEQALVEAAVGAFHQETPEQYPDDYRVEIHVGADSYLVVIHPAEEER